MLKGGFFRGGKDAAGTSLAANLEGVHVGRGARGQGQSWNSVWVLSFVLCFFFFFLPREKREKAAVRDGFWWVGMDELVVVLVVLVGDGLL